MKPLDSENAGRVDLTSPLPAAKHRYTGTPMKKWWNGAGGGGGGLGGVAVVLAGWQWSGRRGPGGPGALTVTTATSRLGYHDPLLRRKAQDNALLSENQRRSVKIGWRHCARPTPRLLPPYSTDGGLCRASA